MLYVRVSCFVVRGCADHLKYCVVCINGQRYASCSECNVVSIECNEPTSYLVQPIGTHGGKVVCTLGVFALGRAWFPELL